MAAERVSEELGGGELRERFRELQGALGALVSEPALEEWERQWEVIAGADAALGAKYLGISMEMQRMLAHAQFMRWCRLAGDAVEASPAAGAALLDAAPEVLDLISPRFLEDWAKACMGGVAGGDAAAVELSRRRFACSARLAGAAGLQPLLQFCKWLTQLLEQGQADALQAFDPALEALVLARDRAGQFLNLLDRHGADEGERLLEFLEVAPGQMRQLPRGAYESVFALLEDLKVVEGLAPAEGIRLLGGLRTLVSEAQAGRLANLAYGLCRRSPRAGRLFLEGLPEALAASGYDHVLVWHRDGEAHRSVEAMERHFDLSESAARGYMQRLASGVLYERVEGVMRIYGQALAGEPVKLLRKVAEERDDVLEREGNAIFLPGTVLEGDDYGSNFAMCKVVASQQAGYLALGSFKLEYGRPSGPLRDLRHGAAGAGAGAGGATSVERFLGLFGDERLANDVFNLVENCRVAKRLAAAYPGLRKDYRVANGMQLNARGGGERLPLRELVLDRLVRGALGDEEPLRVPGGAAAEALREGLAMLGCVAGRDSTVELSAEVAARMYLLLRRIPNERAEGGDWEAVAARAAGEFSESAEEYEARLAELLEQVPAGGEAGGKPFGEDAQYNSPPPVGHWDMFDPEAVQMAVLQAGGEESGGGEEAECLDLAGGAGGGAGAADMDEDSGTELEGDGAGEPLDAPGDGFGDGAGADAQGIADGAEEAAGEVAEELGELYLYDEWDCYGGGYRPRWCSLYEKRVLPGDDLFYRAAMQEHGHLANRLKMQFEAIAPELYRRQKRLLDGDDIDLDEAVSAMVDVRAGAAPESRLYWRRNKQERSTAVAFLLDISASTAEAVSGGQAVRRPAGGAGRIRSGKRILDLERESIVLLAKALEHLGDAYGIYAFSGYGRERVEFHIVKELEESMGLAEVARHLGVLAPLHATRMGPAIRHATRKLEGCDAASKFLFLISDGRPQDKGYSRDGTERDYAVQDTRMALCEAERRGVRPFCLTVDQAGNDYMGSMMGEFSYEVLDDVSALPQRLPQLYQIVTRSR